MSRITLIGILLLTLKGSAQVLRCPGTFPPECMCSDDNLGPVIQCVIISMDTWDIQTTFDAISEAFNNTDAVAFSVFITTSRVTSPGEEVPAHSVSTLKTEFLELWAADTYTRIDPAAFSGTHATTQYLTINYMEFRDTEEAFHLFNNFQVLRGLNLYDTILPQIPAHAFDNTAQSVNNVDIRNAGLHSIGYLPFVKLPNLAYVTLDGNNLTLANISDTAFTFSRTEIRLNLERNPGITHLSEEKFGNFLRENKNLIFVGSGHLNDSDPTYFLQCDDRIDWICNAGVTRIYGYNCLEIGYGDIYGYCEQKFGNSPLYGENSEEVKKIQMADRLRYETAKTEKLRRRSYATSKANRQNQIHL